MGRQINQRAEALWKAGPGKKIIEELLPSRLWWLFLCPKSRTGQKKNLSFDELKVEGVPVGEPNWPIRPMLLTVIDLTIGTGGLPR